MQAEQRDNLLAGAITVTIHVALFLVLLFSLLNTPMPPLEGGSGVVLNLGFVDEGTGEVQTMNEANESPLNQEAKASEIIKETPVPEEKAIEEPKEAKEDWISSEEESGVVAKKDVVKEDKKEEIKREEKKPVQVEVKKAPAQESKPIIEKVDQKSLYGKTGTESEGGNNNGDKDGKVGDQGKPEGELNAKALYGNSGTGGEGKGGNGGASLDMAGWKMDFKIKTDESSENGRLRFRIVVDAEGEVIKIETLEKSVSTSVENYYKRQIESGSFIKDKNAKTAQNSTGYLTIIIRSN